MGEMPEKPYFMRKNSDSGFDMNFKKILGPIILPTMNFHGPASEVL